MPNLSEYTDYKTTLVRAIINDRDCVQLITNSTSTTLPATSLIDTEKSIRQIHLYDYIPDTTTSSKTHVCIEVQDGPAYNSVLAGFYVNIDVIVPESLMRMSGKIRRDALCEEIDKLISNSGKFGLGTPKRVTGDVGKPGDGMRARRIRYFVKDWNNHGATLNADR